MRRWLWLAVAAAGCSGPAEPARPAPKPKVAARPAAPRPKEAPRPVSDPADVVADWLEAHPPAEGAFAAEPNNPGYGGVIQLALLDKASARIVPGEGLREWLDHLPSEQKIAALLSKADDPDEFFARGWADQLGQVDAILRDVIGSAASILLADILREYPRPGEHDRAAEERRERLRGRARKVGKHFARDRHVYFYHYWMLCDRGRSWADWR